MRPLHPEEAQLLALLTFCGADHALLHVSRTALGKGYADATIPLRDFLLRTGIHDFNAQPSGEHAIRYVDVVGLSPEGPQQMKLSFQRPATKNGRMCRVSMLVGLKRPLNLLKGDIILISANQQCLQLCNLTSIARRPADSTTVAHANSPPDGGGAIVAAAKKRVIHVMRCMPECRAVMGPGARSVEIGELSGLVLKQRASLLVNTILDELLVDGHVELVGAKRYRLCH